MTASGRDHDTLRMIADSAGAIVPPGDLRRVRALRFTMPGIDRTVWNEIGALGWIGLRLPEAQGGAELGMDAFCALAEALGRGLVPEPLIQAALSARLLEAHAPAELLSGQTLIVPAWQERPGAIADDGGTILRDGKIFGRKLFVSMAAAADAFVVSFVDGLALLPAQAPGLHLALAETQDGGHFGTLDLAGVTPEAVVPLPAERLADALDEATLALAAYLLGLMEQAFATTLDYLRTRQQFGRAIGSFQALQHRAVDLKVQIALSRASVDSAAAALDAGTPAARRRAAVSRAKARVSEAVMLVTREAIQLHGAIGYTDEADIGLYLRKAMVLANLHGGAAAHRARFAILMPEIDDD